MVKVSSSDILSILRDFGVANDKNVPRHISQIRTSNPTTVSTLVNFRFAKEGFYILFDDTAEDDTDFVLNQVRSDKQDASGDVMQNPKDSITTYAMPFRGKDVYLFAVSSLKNRLDSELARLHPEISRSTWQKYIERGYVKVDGKKATSAKQPVPGGSAIKIDLPAVKTHLKEQLPVIYQDENVIVIDKPAGVLSHSKGALNDEFTVATFFARFSKHNAGTNRPGIIHRLDRDTSGVMIGALNDETAKLLQKQFADRKTKKTYFAVVKGVPSSGKAIIDLPIGRNPSAPSTFRVDAKGKAAVTKYETVKTNGELSLLKLEPQTGRTHQLRVHLSHIGNPIVGDRVYGKPAKRLFLHAASLELTIPKGDRRVFESQVPKEFMEMVQ